MDEYLILKQLLIEIEKKMNWGSTMNWSDQDFEKLGEIINDKSGTLISISTLKRLFGKKTYKERFNPRSDTKDALAKYLGYESWRNYASTYDTNQTKILIPKKNKSILKIIILSIIIFIVAFLLINQYKKNYIPKFYFKPQQTQSNTYPFSVVFDYDFSRFNNDEIYIDFTDNFEKNRWIKLDKTKKIITHLYAFPDLYKIKIYKKNKLINISSIFIKTQGWTCFYKKPEEKEIVQLPFTTSDSVNYFYFPAQELKTKGLDTLSNYNLLYRNITDFPYDADNLTLNIEIRNKNSNQNVICNFMTIIVLAEENRILARFSLPDCFSDNEIQFGEIKFAGKENKLTPFGIDLSIWKKITINTKNKEATILLDGEKLFSTKYQTRMGKVKGFIFISRGSGEFKNLIIN